MVIIARVWRLIYCQPSLFGFQKWNLKDPHTMDAHKLSAWNSSSTPTYCALPCFLTTPLPWGHCWVSSALCNGFIWCSGIYSPFWGCRRASTQSLLCPAPGACPAVPAATPTASKEGRAVPGWHCHPPAPPHPRTLGLLQHLQSLDWRVKWLLSHSIHY